MSLLGISPNKQYRTKVDTLVVGSDEVFNCLQSNPDVGFSKEIFGENANTDRIITYAASFGNATYDAILQAEIMDDISGLISKYAAVSVRDKNSYSIMKQILPDKEISENLDPVLMFDFSKRKRKPVDLTDYIVVYAYSISHWVKKMIENLEVTNIIFITHLAIIRLTNLSESEKN